jgi:hypothetical protein
VSEAEVLRLQPPAKLLFRGGKCNEAVVSLSLFFWKFPKSLSRFYNNPATNWYNCTAEIPRNLVHASRLAAPWSCHTARAFR